MESDTKVRRILTVCLILVATVGSWLFAAHHTMIWRLDIIGIAASTILVVAIALLLETVDRRIAERESKAMLNDALRALVQQLGCIASLTEVSSRDEAWDFELWQIQALYDTVAEAARLTQAAERRARADDLAMRRGLHKVGANIFALKQQAELLLSDSPLSGTRDARLARIRKVIIIGLAGVLPPISALVAEERRVANVVH